MAPLLQITWRAQCKAIPDLIAAMKNGSTYVNVHTEQNQDGE